MRTIRFKKTLNKIYLKLYFYTQDKILFIKSYKHIFISFGIYSLIK